MSEFGYNSLGEAHARSAIAGNNSWKAVEVNDIKIQTIGAEFNDLFVLCSFSLILYFLLTGSFVLVLATLFFLALFYSPPKEKRYNKLEVSL